MDSFLGFMCLLLIFWHCRLVGRKSHVKLFSFHCNFIKCPSKVGQLCTILGPLKLLVENECNSHRLDFCFSCYYLPKHLRWGKGNIESTLNKISHNLHLWFSYSGKSIFAIGGRGITTVSSYHAPPYFIQHNVNTLGGYFHCYNTSSCIKFRTNHVYCADM